MKLIEFDRLRDLGVPHGRVQLWRLVREGRFPKPIKIGSRNAWIASEIDRWIVEQIAKRDGAAVEAA